MEIILLQDVEKLGLRGDVVDVARGYARNYLLPRRLAEVATTARVAELKRVEAQRARHEARSADQAEEIAALLGKTVLTFEVKAGPTGALFGSVTPSDIADEIWRARKVRVDRRKVAIDPIKRIGRYAIPIDVFEDVRVEVKTLVVPEGGELPPEEELEALEAAEAEAEASAEAEAEAAHVEAETAIAEVVASEEASEDQVEPEADAPADDLRDDGGAPTCGARPIRRPKPNEAEAERPKPTPGPKRPEKHATSEARRPGTSRFAALRRSPGESSPAFPQTCWRSAELPAPSVCFRLDNSALVVDRPS